MAIHPTDPPVFRPPARPAQNPDGRRRTPLGDAAFTLVELLVAMAVTLVLIVGLTQVFNGANNSWHHSEAQIDAYREARGALQLMARDLSGTLPASYAQAGGGTGSLTACPVIPTLVLQRSPDTSTESPKAASGPSNDEIYCLTNTGNRGSSSLCAVGYYCEWMPDYLPNSADGIDHKPRAYALLRQSLDSNGTFRRLKTFADRTSANPLQVTDLFSRSGGTPLPGVTQVASYIWDLRFRIDTDLNEQTYPDGDATGVPKDHSQPPLYYDGSTPYPSLLPAYVEIRFKALSEQAARALEGNNSMSPEMWKDPASAAAATGVYKQFIQPNYQQFVLRVPLTSSFPQPTPTP